MKDCQVKDLKIDDVFWDGEAWQVVRAVAPTPLQGGVYMILYRGLFMKHSRGFIKQLGSDTVSVAEPVLARNIKEGMRFLRSGKIITVEQVGAKFVRNYKERWVFTFFNKDAFYYAPADERMYVV